MGSSDPYEPTVGPLRVLVAEDQAIIRLDLRGVLEKHGLIVCAEARDGEEAVELARSSRPDVALLDMRMPKLDGIEAARRMYAEQPIPIVMLTAFSDRSVVEKAIAAGVFAYLVKPFKESDLVPARRSPGCGRRARRPRAPDAGARGRGSPARSTRRHRGMQPWPRLHNSNSSA